MKTFFSVIFLCTFFVNIVAMNEEASNFGVPSWESEDFFNKPKFACGYITLQHKEALNSQGKESTERDQSKKAKKCDEVSQDDAANASDLLSQDQ